VRANDDLWKKIATRASGSPTVHAHPLSRDGLRVHERPPREAMVMKRGCAMRGSRSNSRHAAGSVPPNARKSVSVTRRIQLFLAAAGAMWIPTAAANAPEFELQPAGWHSYIVTLDGRVRDTSFRGSLETALDGPMGGDNLNYDDLVLVMGQCFGGGMLDDTRGFRTSAQTSAARHDEPSYGFKDAAAGVVHTNFYLDAWSNAVNTADQRNMFAAYTEARNQDRTGPVKKVHPAFP
jgi:hypothetical protein